MIFTLGILNIRKVGKWFFDWKINLLFIHTLFDINLHSHNTQNSEFRYKY